MFTVWVVCLFIGWAVCLQFELFSLSCLFVYRMSSFQCSVWEHIKSQVSFYRLRHFPPSISCRTVHAVQNVHRSCMPPSIISQAGYLCFFLIFSWDFFLKALPWFFRTHDCTWSNLSRCFIPFRCRIRNLFKWAPFSFFMHKPVRIRRSSHDLGWQSSHSVDLAGWQAKKAFIEIWMTWRNAHTPHSLFLCTSWYTRVIETFLFEFFFFFLENEERRMPHFKCFPCLAEGVSPTSDGAGGGGGVATLIAGLGGPNPWQQSGCEITKGSRTHWSRA